MNNQESQTRITTTVQWGDHVEYNEHIKLRDTSLHWHIYVDTREGSPTVGKLIANLKFNIIHQDRAGPFSSRRGERENPKDSSYQMQVGRVWRDIISEIKNVIDMDSEQYQTITDEHHGYGYASTFYPTASDPPKAQADAFLEGI